MCMWRKLTWTLTCPQPSDMTYHAHVTQVNMNVNIPPNPVTWRSMCMWHKLTWTLTSPLNPVTWRSMCMWRKLTWTLLPPLPNSFKNECFQKRARLLARFSPTGLNKTPKQDQSSARFVFQPHLRHWFPRNSWGGWRHDWYPRLSSYQKHGNVQVINKFQEAAT